MRDGSLATALGVVALALMAACGPSHEFHGEVVDPPGPPPTLTGTNWDSRTFRFSDVEGRVTVLFFGYTYCPDVCPLTLAKMKQLYTNLGERADEVAVIFASVDPHRDTLEKMAQYVPAFDRRFFGLRLDQEQLETAEDELGLAVQYGQPKEGPGSDSYYYVDHTGTYFLFDRSGSLRVKLPPNATIDQIQPDVEALLAG